MNLFQSKGISSLTIALIVLSCAAPTAALNIWPRVEQMLAGGITGNQIGIVILVTVSAIGMTAIPFAMAKAPNWGFWFTCLLCGAGLCIVNYLMAVGAVGKVRDAEAGAAAATIARAHQLRSSISESRKQRDALPPFKWTTEDMVTAANEAVRLAVEARDQECGKVGEWCRARQAQVSARLEERAGISAARAFTTQREKFEGEIQKLQQDLQNLGAIPASSDQQASRIAIVVSGFMDLGPRAADRVADAIITILAITAEGIALLLPRILVTAVAKHHPPVSPATLFTLSLPRARPLPAPKRKALPPPTGQPGDIKTWFAAQIQPKAGALLKTWDVYKAYASWCASAGLPAVTATVFDFTLQELKVGTERSGSRNFYKDIELKG